VICQLVQVPQDCGAPDVLHDAVRASDGLDGPYALRLGPSTQPGVQPEAHSYTSRRAIELLDMHATAACRAAGAQSVARTQAQQQQAGYYARTTQQEVT